MVSINLRNQKLPSSLQKANTSTHFEQKVSDDHLSCTQDKVMFNS